MIALPPSCRIPTGLKRGDTGRGTSCLQEWLTLAGHRVAIDTDFGPATERALMAFGGAPALDPFVAERLLAPMSRALAAEGSLLDIAHAHLAGHPREVGGANRGPWVRLYCGDGEGLPWCAFAARFLARQAGDPWAERISPHLNLKEPRSPSLRKFIEGINREVSRR